MKDNLIALVLITLMATGVYLGYFVQDEGLIHVGIFITWFFSIVFFLSIFIEKRERNSKIKQLTRITANIVLFLCVIALSYVGQYAHAAIWLLVFLDAILIDNKGLKND